MMMTKFSFIALTLASLLALGACSDAKKELGLVKSSPDEFAVVKRAPLEMPPDFTLRPPEPGAPRPQELSTAAQARQVMLGSNSASTVQTQGESALLNEAKAGAAPDIRRVVDSESAKTDRKNQPVAKRLLHIGDDKPDAKVVDPVAESQRLKNNAANGQPVTKGETPSVDD